MRRFPASVYSVGEEPDARFSLANERTFLAWTRTALALIAAGVALEVLGLDLHAGFRLAASLLLIVGGTVVAPFAWWEWMRSERALRLSQPLPGAFSAALLAGIVVVVGLLVLAGVLWR
ncbi:YidH family protein [Microbacterium sp. 179-I 3D3 NHS]|uniref:YidH family protein n=1 Tax=Microbacterium sp. 179-I 3D3 NHS TaxID=3142382 RepID=UPI0039A18ACE